jgi:thiol:disulfide interchange protein DsbD
MRLLVCALAAVTWLASVAGAVAAPGPQDLKVRTELVGEVGSVEPGATFWLGLHQRIAPGWHTYWINPGDSGEPATVAWTLPPGFVAGPIVWPHPERIPTGSLMSYGYTGEVVLLVPVTAPRGLDPGTRVTLGGRASWLVCEKICIPEEAAVELALPVGSAPSEPAGAALIRTARRAVPVPSPWPVSFSLAPDSVSLRIAAAGFAAERVDDVWFYPSRGGVIDHAAPQDARIGADGLTLRVRRGPGSEPIGASLDGVLVVTERLDRGPTRQAFSVSSVRGAAGAHAEPGFLLPAVALALAGGLLLNLMPCVLPVLSVKALAIVRHADVDRLRRHGAAYTAGVLVSFALVAGALLALRAGGEQVGWGFQLQSPPVVTLLAYVFFAMALALSGVLGISGRFAGAGDALAARAGYAGSFFTGALATVAATPCTAPFMGVAVGFALTQSWTTALLVFEALGLGLALPYLLLTLVPGWRRLVPRPGPWMDVLKQLLAFPLYGSVVWLVWVVSRQAGPAGVVVVLTGLVLIALAAWLHATTRTARARWRRLGAAASLASALLALALGSTVVGASPEPALPRADGGAPWEPFRAERLAELRARGTPVFLNVTAAWCITCLVNERVALRGPAVAEAFARRGVVYLKADWTTRDAEITKVLGAFGRSGVPLYVLYSGGPPAGTPSPAPLVLPQILTEGTILDAVGKI